MAIRGISPKIAEDWPLLMLRAQMAILYKEV